MSVRSCDGERPGTRRRTLAAGGAAAVILAAAACSVPSAAPVSRAAPVSSPAPGSPATPGPGAAGPDFAENCLAVPLKAQLAAAVRSGASVIVAVGTPTGKSVAGKPAAVNHAAVNHSAVNHAAGAAPAFYAMILRSVRTLRGPAAASGETAWSPGPAPGTPADPVNSELLAPGGRLFAIVWPTSAGHAPAGPTLQLAPVVGADVVFTPFGCWDLTGLQPGQYQASTPLRPVPGGADFGGVRQAAENGLYTVPLTTVERIAASA